MNTTPPEGADDIVAAQRPSDHDASDYNKHGRLKGTVYEAEMERIQEQLVLLQYWIASQGLKVAVIFEGRGSAGKGGVIKRITERTSPRTVRVVALPKPTERERTQWYFQRYVKHLPAAGEMVLFDRSWYNRSNVEWVMGYCSEEQHQEFLRSCPEFERMLVRSGITVLKYWFSVSFEEQRRRFEARNSEPLKRWKLSDMDLAEHELYVRYSMAKDTTFQYTDIKQAPWYVVPSDDKRASRINCMSHLLSQFDFVDVAPDVVELPTMREIPVHAAADARADVRAAGLLTRRQVRVADGRLVQHPGDGEAGDGGEAGGAGEGPDQELGRVGESRREGVRLRVGDEARDRQGQRGGAEDDGQTVESADDRGHRHLGDGRRLEGREAGRAPAHHGLRAQRTVDVGEHLAVHVIVAPGHVEQVGLDLEHDERLGHVSVVAVEHAPDLLVSRGVEETRLGQRHAVRRGRVGARRLRLLPVGQRRDVEDPHAVILPHGGCG